jgi:hypothetical protein
MLAKYILNSIKGCFINIILTMNITMLLIIITVLLSSRLSNWLQQSSGTTEISHFINNYLMVLIKSFENVLVIGLHTVILAWGLNLKVDLTIWSVISIVTLQYLIKSQSHFPYFIDIERLELKVGLYQFWQISIFRIVSYNIASSFSLQTRVTLTSIWPS